jgi:hypothetical protein
MPVEREALAQEGAVLLSTRPQWFRLLVTTVGLPLIIALAILAFAWPAARIAPRDAPVGIVGASEAAEVTAGHLRAADPGAFKFRLYPDTASAVHAIHQREVAGSAPGLC